MVNDKIRELIEQATISYSNGQERTFDKEKFAELIIRECAEIAEDYDGAHYVGTKIKDHFGVK
jgi:hypothetical protein